MPRVLADIDAGGWAVLGSLATAVATAVVMVLKAYWDQRRAARTEAAAAERQSRSDALAEQGTIITRLEAQVERMQRQADEAMRALERVRDAHADCEVRLERSLGWCQRLHDAVLRANAALRKMGNCPGPDPEVPAMPATAKDPAADPDFIVRTEKQIAELSRALAETVRAKGAGQGTSGAPPQPPPTPAVPGGAGT